MGTTSSRSARQKQRSPATTTSTKTKVTFDEVPERSDQGSSSTKAESLQVPVPTRRGGKSRSSNSNRVSFYEMVDAHEVLPYLLVGNSPSSNDEEYLARKHVRYALNLSNTPVEYPFEGIEYKSVFIEDEEEEDLLGHLPECLDFLQKVRRESEKSPNPKLQPKVLIYSYFGLSRSCAVVLAHLMKEEEWSLKESWRYLRTYHPSAKPNDGFLIQLLQYERELRGNRITMTIQDFYSR